MQELLENRDKARRSLKAIQDKQFKIYFLIVEAAFPSAYVYEIYNAVRTLSNAGYDVSLITDNKDYRAPSFLDDDMKDFNHIVSDGQVKFNIEHHDVLVIPELLTYMLEHLKKVNCQKILFFQSMDNSTKGLIAGTDYAQFGVNNIITTSEKLKDYFIRFYGNAFDVQSYTLGIPDYFEYKGEHKQPRVLIYSRNVAEAEKVIKLFYSKFPHLRFVTFESPYGPEGQGVSRYELAQLMKRSIATIWLDRPASHGTLPLEAMKAQNVPIGLVPDIQHAYIDGKNGLWSTNLYDLPELINTFFMFYLQDNMPEELLDGLKETADKYSPEISSASLLNSFEYYLNKASVFYQEYIVNADAKLNDQPQASVVE